MERVGKIVYSHLLMRMDLLCMKQATQKRTVEAFVGRRCLRGSSDGSCDDRTMSNDRRWRAGDGGLMTLATMAYSSERIVTRSLCQPSAAHSSRRMDGSETT